MWEIRRCDTGWAYVTVPELSDRWMVRHSKVWQKYMSLFYIGGGLLALNRFKKIVCYTPGSGQQAGGSTLVRIQTLAVLGYIGLKSKRGLNNENVR